MQNLLENFNNDNVNATWSCHDRYAPDHDNWARVGTHNQCVIYASKHSRLRLVQQFEIGYGNVTAYFLAIYLHVKLIFEWQPNGLDSLVAVDATKGLRECPSA